MNQRAAQDLFRRLNAELFGGKLPPYRVRLVRGFRFPGFTDVPGHTISMKSHMTDDRTEIVLLHEMTHHVAPGHGPEWQAEMLRVFRLYRRNRHWVMEALFLSDLMDSVLIHDGANWPASPARKALSKILGRGYLKRVEEGSPFWQVGE